MRVSDAARLHELIVSGMSHAVGATTGSLAVYSPAEGSLAIVATHGYPRVLVDHVRVRPSEGIIGSVFSSRRALLAAVNGESDAEPRRRRYRTDSYLAVPLRGPEGVLGVVTVTDRADGQAFTRRDLRTLKAYAVPAALALSREHLRQHSTDLAHQATVDALTGVFNRWYFDGRLEQEIQRQRREAGELALLMIDIDDFKGLNDTRGHLHGDRVLQEVADILRRSVRIFDVCARYGGEEFAILMPGANAPVAVQIAERIRRQTEVHFGGDWRYTGGRPTLSVGVSTATAAATGESLVAEADSALLSAKASGKNIVKLYAAGRPAESAPGSWGSP